jgi:hypothetical protein
MIEKTWQEISNDFINNYFHEYKNDPNHVVNEMGWGRFNIVLLGL